MSSDNDVHVMLLDASKAFDCVHYVILFERLLQKGLCPLVTRALLYMHVAQRVDVRWNSSKSESFSVSNGVKQGGILSPVLFTIYTDIMLTKLRDCGVGCYIGNVFCGALAYADDIVILAPNKSALITMLNVARVCADSLRLRFNGAKSQYLVFRSSGSDLSQCQNAIDFCGVHVSETPEGIHLGNLLGPLSRIHSVTKAVSDLYMRTNVLLSRFKFCSPDVRYKLFKSQCVIVYGSPLWDFDTTVVADFSIAWRKCVRRVWGLPNRTHCNLLPGVCNDRDIKFQLLCRSMNFIRKACSTHNEVLRLCPKLVLCGSGSALSNSMSHISDVSGISRHRLCNFGNSRIFPLCGTSPLHGTIREFAMAKHSARGVDRDNFEEILIELCVN